MSFLFPFTINRVWGSFFGKISFTKRHFLIFFGVLLPNCFFGGNYPVFFDPQPYLLHKHHVS